MKSNIPCVIISIVRKVLSDDMEEIMKAFIKRYRHAWIIIAYAALYIPWFSYLEHRNVVNYHIIHMAADDLIPFNEFFIVPYLMWFLFVPATVVFLLFVGKSDFYKVCIFLFTGMTVFLIVSTVYPNGDTLRPTVFPRDNIFTSLVLWLYGADTSTNLFPSIHVYNSLGAFLALLNCEKLQNRNGRKIQTGAGILCALIIMSTMFLKQHSVFDVITAFIMAAVMWIITYGIDYKSLAMKRQQSKQQVYGFNR